jgi:ABC-type phosphate/phosphonate transport system ATPase subunit
MLDQVLHEVGIGHRTVLLTTHNLERGLSLSQRVAALVQGRKAFEMDPDSWDPERLRQVYGQRTANDGSGQ